MSNQCHYDDGSDIWLSDVSLGDAELGGAGLKDDGHCRLMEEVLGGHAIASGLKQLLNLSLLNTMIFHVKVACRGLVCGSDPPFLEPQILLPLSRVKNGHCLTHPTHGVMIRCRVPWLDLEKGALDIEDAAIALNLGIRNHCTNKGRLALQHRPKGGW